MSHPPQPGDPKESIRYHINRLLVALETPTEAGRYRSMVRGAGHLYTLIKVAAIWEERGNIEQVGPFIAIDVDEDWILSKTKKTSRLSKWLKLRKG